jgi:hypothetical protein
MKGLVVYSGARYITLTGEHPFQRWGYIFPGPPGIFKHWLALLLGVLSVICFPAWMAGFMAGLGQLTNWVFHTDVNPNIWAVMWVVLAWASLFIAGYDKVEKFQTILVVLMVGFSFVALILAGVDFGGLFRGLIPSVPSGYEPWVQEGFPKIADRPITLELVAYLGALGGGTYDYIGYLGTFREKRWGMLGTPDIEHVRLQLQQLEKNQPIPLATDAENYADAKAWTRAPLIDTTTSFIAVTIFAVTFLALGSRILGVDGLQQAPGDTDILKYQAQFFTQLNPVMLYFYQICVWAAFFGSMQAAMTTVYPHTVREAFAPAFPKMNLEHNWPKIRIGVATYCAVVAIILVLTGFSYIWLITFAGALGGVFTLGIWGLAQIYTEHKMLPKELRMKPVVTWLVGISGTVLLVLGFVGVLQAVGVRFS